MKPNRIAAAALASVAVLTSSVKASDEVLLFPAGEFRAKDGRPANAPAWRMDAEIAAALIAQAKAAGIDFVIDYEHQTLLADDNGQPAPAAGWFGVLEWREGDGLYAVGVKWTKRAQDYIAADEYRYISPVFTYDKTGRVLKLLHVALTNNPALDNQPGVAEAVAAKYLASLSNNPQENNVDELLERCRWLLNLPITATAEDISAELQKLIDQIKGADTDAAAAASFDLRKFLANTHTEVAALKVAAPDPAKFVSVAMLATTQGELLAANNQLAALRAEGAARELDEVMTAALAAGKLLPAQEESMREWGKKDIAALKGFIANAPVVAPVQMQNGGKQPVGNNPQPGDTDVAVMKALGLTAEQFAAGKISQEV